MKMKTKSLALTFALSITGAANASGNLISNGDFDAGLSGWTTFTTSHGSLGHAGYPNVSNFNTTGFGASSAATFQVGELSYTTIYEGGGISQSFNAAAGGSFNFYADVASYATFATNGSGGRFRLIVDELTVATWDSGIIPMGDTFSSALSGTSTLTAGIHTLSLLIDRPYMNGTWAGHTPFQYLDNISVTSTAQAIPEPETYAMLLAGLGVMATVARRKQKAA